MPPIIMSPVRLESMPSEIRNPNIDIQVHGGGDLVGSEIFDRQQEGQVSMPRIVTGDWQTDNLLQYLYRRSVNNDRSLSKELDKYIKLFTKKKSAQTFSE